MSTDVRRFVGFLLLATLGGMAAVVLLPKMLGVAAGPEAELIFRLKKSEREGLQLPVPGQKGELKSARHEYMRLSVELDPVGRTANVAGTLDFEGSYGQTNVHSLGLERVRFAWEDGDWEAKGGFAPRLVAVVAALEKRRRELDQGALTEPGSFGILPSEAASLLAIRGRRYFSQDWYIRVEPDGARVTEAFRVIGTLPSRPVDDKGRTELSLQRRGEEFFFRRKGE